MDIVEATNKYESWLSRHVDVVSDDVEVKHASMRESLGHFFRATYPRWCELWPDRCAAVATLPSVVAAGDLHVDAFGVWRDDDHRLVWGVFDLDEAWWLPFTHDLVRLGLSVKLAIEGGHIRLDEEHALAALLDGYRAALERGGEPFVLAERHAHLAALLQDRVRAAARFWRAVEGAVLVPRASIPEALRRALSRSLPRDCKIVGFGHRLGAPGTLGRPSFVAWGSWRGSLVGREVRLATPPAVAFASRAGRVRADVLDRLRRSPTRADDPSLRIEADGWVLRRVAPDCTQVELASLPSGRHDARLLGAMGQETANLHLATRPAVELLEALDGLPPSWLADSVTAMGEALRADWARWCAPR